MSGQALFEDYMARFFTDALTPDEQEHFQLLRTARKVVGETALYAAMEEAQQTNRQIVLTYPIPFAEGPSTPSGIRLVARASLV
ncbi:hypothetical protein [Spirosoma linguale]|uniref:Uncharacterized protein n=1 Tax=Spirosoma linguale (strain ATCC 33905 / DSM 74 / LMG 10896 / Claus 1) TaxID=504472 RepID=D2QVW1_SPILD|nr:hypothetical protein Slin_7000 [Spirosoma linguale DSM 74]